MAGGRQRTGRPLQQQRPLLAQRQRGRLQVALRGRRAHQAAAAAAAAAAARPARQRNAAHVRVARRGGQAAPQRGRPPLALGAVAAVDVHALREPARRRAWGTLQGLRRGIRHLHAGQAAPRLRERGAAAAAARAPRRAARARAKVRRRRHPGRGCLHREARAVVAPAQRGRQRVFGAEHLGSQPLPALVALRAWRGPVSTSSTPCGARCERQHHTVPVAAGTGVPAAT